MGCGAVQNPQASQPGIRSINKQKQTQQDKLSSNKNISNKNKQNHSIPDSYIDNNSHKETLNRAYQIKELLGKGTYGEVYRCIKLQTREQFALKCIKLKAKSKQEAKRHINNLKGQISVLKKLNHPNIIKYYSFDISPDNQTVEIVFQLVQNGSLKDFLDQNGPLPEGEASIICKQILEGLDYLHEKSIIHRDLKCANILMTNNGIVKITDFGTAKQVKVKTNQDIAKLCASLKGTPYYMAPEILKRSGHHKSADVWSFGCTLIQMLTGKAPWTTLTDNFEQIISYIISGIHPPLPTNISKQCQFFIQSCLDSVPSQRLTARELLNHRFITNNFKGLSPSLAYQKQFPQSIVSNRTKKKAQQIQIMNMESVEITRRKKSSIQEFPENDSMDLGSKSGFSKKLNKDKVQRTRHSNMYLDNMKYNDNSQPFLNYYATSTKNRQIDVSEPYIPMKKQNIKSAKRNSNNELKKVAKTAGHLKMTQQNLTNWNQIQEEMIQNQSKTNYSKKSKYSGLKSNQYNEAHSSKSSKQNSKNQTLQNTKQLRSNTEIQQVDEQNQPIISTSLANQQRNRYLQSQQRLKQKKQLQKMKWQQQLKRQRQGKNSIRGR